MKAPKLRLVGFYVQDKASKQVMKKLKEQGTSLKRELENFFETEKPSKALRQALKNYNSNKWKPTLKN